MPAYSIRVWETRTVSVLYSIDADSPEEAIAKAEIGETEWEGDECDLSVTDRQAMPESLTVEEEFA